MADHLNQRAASALISASTYVRGVAECTKWHDRDRKAAFDVLEDMGRVHADLIKVNDADQEGSKP